MNGAIHFTIPGVVPSLKNQKRIGNRRMFDDDQVKAYKRDFPLLCPSRFRKLNLGSSERFLQVTVMIYHDNWKRDADAEIIFDCLQTAGVISNDRWIRVKHISAKMIDPQNPRAVIWVEEITTGEVEQGIQVVEL